MKGELVVELHTCLSRGSDCHSCWQAAAD